ncbi:hypothetical protein HPP92_018134 [Vanilla planifolia]|uniref:Uncharacterized protein n=1 Tax=Vanilla planifolia TaxID=51239 RepID=A0A835UR87_VANPL|nr:hypothetical protein HPP92_018134 [Vanilla planifolia]
MMTGWAPRNRGCSGTSTRAKRSRRQEPGRIPKRTRLPLPRVTRTHVMNRLSSPVPEEAQPLRVLFGEASADEERFGSVEDGDDEDEDFHQGISAARKGREHGREEEAEEQTKTVATRARGSHR